jgi:hypothetical protein
VVYDTYRRRAVGSGLSWAIRGITAGSCTSSRERGRGAKWGTRC